MSSDDFGYRNGAPTRCVVTVYGLTLPLFLERFQAVDLFVCDRLCYLGFVYN